jgi:flavodoxin
MKALVIFDTNYGNTKLVADSIAGQLGEGARSASVKDLRDSDLAGIGLLVVGSPIIG